MSASAYTVFGGGGFIGGRVVNHLSALGHECFVPTREDDSVLRRPLGHIVYAIGVTADFRLRPFDTVQAHICRLSQILESAEFESLTYLSSTRVYAGAQDTTEGTSLCVNPNDASDLYNLSKLMGESLCLHAGRPNVTIARLSNIIGHCADANTFISQLLEEGRRSGRVVLRTSLASRKDYLNIDDAVDLITRIASSGEHGIYNVASGEAVTNRQIADALTREMSYEVFVLPDAPTWEFTAVDIAKSKSRFGFSPRRFTEYFPAFLHEYHSTEST
jgi:nucleoside-diphosphate-sugar epimerase